MPKKYWWEEGGSQTSKQTNTQSNTKKEKKYWWEDDTNQESTQGNSSGHWWDDNNYASMVGDDITNKVNAWLNKHNSYLSEYQKRYEGRKYSYEDAYVSDSSDWLNTISQKKSEFDAEADSIFSYIDQNKGYLDQDWIDEIKYAITSARGTQNQLLISSKRDNDYWAKFNPNEEQVAAGYTPEKLYTEWQADRKQHADDLVFDVEAGMVDLEKLKQEKDAYLADQEEKRKQARSEESWLDKIVRWSGNSPDTSLPIVGSGGYSSDTINTSQYDKLIAEKEAQIERAKYAQGYEGYMGNMDAEDYAANSKYVSTRTDVAMEDATWGLYNDRFDTSKLFGDYLYDYINRNPDALGAATVNDTASSAYLLGFDQGFLKTMTDEEIGVYNYLYKTQGSESANEYLSFIESDLEGRRRVQEQAFWAAYAKESPVASSVFSTLISPLKGFSYLGQAADMLDDGKMDENAGYNRFSYIPSSIRSQVSSTIEKSGKWGKVGSFAYNTGMSMADFLFTTAVSGGNQGLSLAIMGSGAAADATLAAKDRGLDDGQAFALGTIAGLAEVAMEKISLGAWLEGDMTEGALRYVLKNALSEGGEEAGTSVANLLADIIIAGDKSEWKMAIQSYIDQGKSEEEAFALVLAENAAQIGLDALGGILSGAAIGGGTYAGSSIAAGFEYGKTGKDKTYTQKLVAEGIELNPDSKYVQKAKSKVDKGKNLTGMQVRNILAANNEQITANDMKKIQQAAEKRLTSLGQTEDVRKVAELATKYATGGKLTRAETSFLANSKYGSRVANELLPENIASGDYSTEWAENIGTKQVNFGAYNIRAIVDEMLNKGQYKSLESRMEGETPAKVSDTGKAVISGTNEEIDLAKPTFKQITDEGVVLLVNGKDVRSDNIDYESEDQALAINSIGKIEHITPEVASALYAKLDMTKPVMKQLNGIDEAFTYGYYNYSEADLEAGTFTGDLTKDQLNDAFKLGQHVRKNDTDAKADAFKQMRTAANAIAEKNAAEGKAAPGAKNLTLTYNKGNGEVVSIDEAKLNDQQSGGVEWAKILHKMGLGTKVEFFESYLSDTLTVKDKKTGEVKKARVFINDAGVEQIAYSGVYRKSDGTIRIDLNAYNGKGFTLNALAHELTHFIQQWSDKKYKTLVDFLMKEYEKTDMTMHERVIREQKRLEDIRGEKVSYDEAYDEVVANAMNKMFDDGKMAEKLAKLKEQDKNLAQKLWEGFKEILAKFMGFYEKEGLFRDANVLVEMKETFDQLQNMFAEALVEASENYQASIITKEAGMEFVAAEDVSQYSYSSLAEAAGFVAVENEDGTRSFTRDGKKVNKVTVDDIDNSPIGAFINFSLEMGDISEADAKRQKQMFADICTMACKTNDFAMTMQFVGSAVFTGMKANADKQYGTTYDFPSICTKTQAVIDAMSAKMMSLGRGLNTEEIVQLYNDVFASGNPVPCPECYVFSRWIGIGGLLDNIKKYQDYYGDMDVKDVAAAYLKMKAEVSKFAEEQGISFGKAKGALTSKLTKEFNKLTEKIEKNENQGENVKASDRQRLAELEPMMNTVKSMTWLENVYFADSSLKKVNPNFRVPDSVLFDLNNGEAFATKYKEAWAFRTTQGAGYGKAITPYAEARLGEGVLVTNNTTNAIKGKAKGSLDNYFLSQMGKLDKKSRDALKKARLKQKIQAFLGGQRFQSTSDARYENASDYLLAALEMQAMGGMVQCYTKVDGAVPAFSAWGFSINQSLMPLNGGLDANGNVKDTGVGGMKPSVAFENRNKYESAGTITIGVNDNHIRAMFKQWVRDFIIPYHASGGKADVVAAFRSIQEGKEAKGKAVRSTDYSRTQSDKVLSDDVLRWQGKTDAQIQRIHEIRNARIAILTGGKPNMTVVRSNRFLSALYDKFNGGEWDGVKIAKSKVESQIFPNEFWDQTVTYEESAKITKDYLEYCEDLGFLHRFSGMVPSNGKLVPVNGYNENGERVQLTDLAYKYDADGNKTTEVEEFFWKVLTDRRMYDNNGNYLAQKTVTLNDTTTDTVTGFAKNNQGREYDKAKAEALTKKILDNSSVGNENRLTENKARGEVNDIRGVRKGTEEATGVSETDGRGYSEYVGASQEVKSWDRLSNLARRQIVGIVDSHIKASKSQYEVFALISGIANISKEGLTTAQKTNAIHKVTEQIYSDAITMPSLLFEDKWRILGKANELRREIIAATKTKPSDGEKNLDSDGRQITKGQQQFFKDTKVVDKNGRLLVMYHGSSSNIRFTVFELRSMVNGRIYGEGYYFTEDKNEALNWGGGQLYEVYVNLSNPYYASTKMEAPEAIVALAKENYGRTYDRLSQDPNWWGSKYTREEYIEQNSRMWSNSDLALESAIDTSDIPEKGFSEELARRKTELLRSLHYDGVIVTTSKSNRNFHEVVAFDPEQIKLTTNKNPTKNIDMQYSSQETDADNAPVFYSRMGKVVEGMKQEKFGASSVISMLRGRGVKAEEIRWSGIQAFLDGKKSVTKDELLEFINGSMLHIEEEIGSGGAEISFEPAYATRDGESNDLVVMRGGTQFDTLEWDEDNHEFTSELLGYIFSDEDEALEYYKSKYGGGGTRWGDYKLDGGENYRELLFRLPGADYYNRAMQNHWGDHAVGVLAHARMQDFEVDGKKMLFIEEIQSDWHNAGHKHGYNNELDYAEVAALKDQAEIARSEVSDAYVEYKRVEGEYHKILRDFGMASGDVETWQQRIKDAMEKTAKASLTHDHARHKFVELQNKLQKIGNKAPDAPFKETYHEFVIKRLLRMAAEQGYDSIGWTTADIQSQRWSDEYAEGYRIEYDQDIPKFLKKYGKQWGAEVGKSEITTGKLTDWEADMIEKGIIEVELPTSSVWSMAITPAMKKSVLEEGQELYSEHETDYSNRSLLANAFEGITKDSIEYTMIQDYKGHIQVLNMLDKRLSVLNEQIRDIRFTKGKYDAEKLKELENEREEVIGEINRYDKMLLNLEASEPLRKVIVRERQKEAKKTKEHVKEIQQNKKLRAEQTELRHKIRKAIRDLDKILNRGNKKVNVKDDLQPVVTKALQAAETLFTDNYGNYDMLRNGIGADLSDAEEALVETCAKMLKDLDKMPTDGYENFQARQEAENRLKTKMSKLNEVFARERKRLNNTKVSSILGELADAYKSLETSDQSYVQGAYSEPVYNFLKNLQNEVGGTIVKDMSKDQLESVYAAYMMVLTTVRKANKMFNEELKQTREQLGNAVIQEVLNAGGVHLLGTKLGDAISQFDWNNMKPIWLENRVGSETFGKLVNGLFKGQYNFAVDIDGAKQFKLEMDKKYKPRNWDAEKQYKFQSSTGKEFSLNLQQIMSLYAFSKREQAYSHLLNGGFVFEENSTVVVDGKLGIKKTYIHKGAASYKLNEATLNSIINSLTKEQKAYVDEMQKYLSDVMGAKGNEVSMQLYGIKMFNEQFYFPLRSSGAYMERAKEAELKKQQGQINLVNSGFTHSVKPEAKNPIILSGFMDVWAEHCNEMSMYHSMVLPMEDFRKVYNYSTIHDENMESASVYQTIQDAYGKAATNYIDHLYRELNAGATVDPREAPFKRWISNFKKAAVMLSGSVVVQQFSSIGRAYDIIDPKYFIGAKVNSGTNLSVADEMKKYAPVAIIKEMGGFDTGTKGSAKSYIMAEQYGKGERVKGLLKDEQYRGDIMGYLPAKADELTWSAIWEAVKRETKAKNPKMDVKSEEFLKLAGERFSEVIEKTQVYDSVLARSANMRSKGNFMAMATAFMAEPTTTINLLEDAIRSGKANNIARAFGSVAVSIILNNALASIVYAMRDDDDDETFLEKYFQAFTSGMIDDINPMSYYPFLKDVYSLFQGYDVERTDMSVIADVRDALKRVVSLLGKDTSEMDDDELAEHYKQVNEVFMGLLDAGCSMFGVPLKNVRRDALAIVNGIKTIGTDFSDERDNSWLSFWDKVGAATKDTIPIYAWTKDRAKGDKLYDAIISGDKKYLARLKSTYKTDSAYQSAVRKALRENDSRIKEAAQARYEGKTEEYKRIFREIQKEGKFGFDDIMSAINTELSKLEPDKVTSEYSANSFVEAVAAGNASHAATIMDDIIATHIANGKTQAEAEAEFATAVATGIKNAYSSGLLDEAGAEKMLMEYADMDEEDATSRVDYWDFCNENPKYANDIGEAKYNKYKEFAEPAGISVDVYAQFLNGTKDLADIKDEWGDVEVTKREQVLEVINSLPLTWQQKDALYLAAGYAESKIWDVPW